MKLYLHPGDGAKLLWFGVKDNNTCRTFISNYSNGNWSIGKLITIDWDQFDFIPFTEPWLINSGTINEKTKPMIKSFLQELAEKA